MRDMTKVFKASISDMRDMTRVFKASISENSDFNDGDRSDLGIFSSIEKAKKRLAIEIEKDKKSSPDGQPYEYTVYEVHEVPVDDLNHHPKYNRTVFKLKQTDIPNFSSIMVHK